MDRMNDFYQKNDIENHYREKLANERRNSSSKKNKLDQAKKVAKVASDLAKPWGGLSLLKYIHFSVDWLMAFAIAAAVLKDILDWIGFSLPVINEIINFSVALITTGALLLMGSDKGTQKMVKKQMKKWFVLIAGVGAEEFFGLNFLPWETIAVLVCYFLVLVERKMAAEEAKEQGQGQEQPEYG